jgi:hypothetical protein
VKNYIGVKQVRAKEMSKQEYNDFRGWELPYDENGSDEGYLVEYLDGGASNTEKYDGYVSWSPKDVFERSYREINGLTFGLALEAMNKGEKVARKGWNGKGMWIAKSGPTPVLLEADKFWNKHSKKAAEENGGSMEVLPYLIMKTADNKILMGWLASQTDMLAEDWEIVD